MRTPRSLLPRAAVAAACVAALPPAGARAQQQQRRVTGLVTGEGGAPLPGATVQVIGAQAGAYTNEAGRFTLAVPAGAQTVRVRRIGYQARLVTVAAGQTDVGTVTLARDVLQLETQVVTGVGTTISRRNAANDVAVVGGAELTRVPQPTVDNALQGKVAGATVTQNSGAPGGGAQFRIRGANSILGNADPLLIVDGVIISNDAIQPGTNAVLQASTASRGASDQDNGVNRIADLNPNDVENIEVLKGASASQIYGSRASNGVIIVTTRRGQAGRPVFGLTQRVGGYSVLRTLDERRYSLAEAYASGAAVGLDSAAVRANYASCNGFCDHQRELFGTSDLSYETALSVRGGGTGAQYYVSGLAKRDGGLAVNTGYNKQSLRANLTTALGPRLNAQVSANLVHSLTQRGFTNNDNVNVTPYFVFPATPTWFDLRPQNGAYPVNPFTASNPLETFAGSRTPEEVWRQIGSVTADYSVFAADRQTLTLRVNGGIDFFNQQNNVVAPANLQFQRPLPNPGLLTLQSGNNIFGNTAVTLAHVYRPAAGSFTTSVGTQYEYRSQRVGNTVGQGVLAGQENLQNAAVTQTFDFRLRQRDLAYFAQEEFLGLGERLLLTGGVRAQRSTVNGNQNKFYVFPRAAASYRVPGLPSAVSDLKLRLAYGASGNPPLIQSQFTPVAISVYGGQNAVTPGLRLGASTIRPELQRELEGGVDLTLFGNRATVGVTGYNRSLSDLLLEPTVAGSRGINVLDLNGGRMRNRGVEVNASGTLVQTPNVSWVPRLVFSRNVNRVTGLPDIVGRVQCLNAARTGLETNPLNCPRGFTAGAFGFDLGQGRVEEGQSLTQVVGTDTVPGTGCGAGAATCATYARKYGDTEPKFTLGFSNDVTVHGVRLYALLDWRYRFSIVNVTENTYDFFGALADTAGTSRRLAQYQTVAPYIQDGTFLMLREVTLGYTLPAALARRVLRGRASSLSLELSGRNLALATKYQGLTPEVSNFGNTNVVRNQDLAPFPQSRSYFLSVNVGF